MTSHPEGESRTYGQVTLLEKLHVLLMASAMPAYIASRVILSPFSSRDKGKTLSEIVSQAKLRWLFGRLSHYQIQWLIGDDIVGYKKWARATKNTEFVDELQNGAKLLWVGPKRTERVLLYFHGGGFVFPMMDPHIYFLDHVRRENERFGNPTGAAMLSYNIIPSGGFPSQLREARDAIETLLGQGVLAKNIILMGDSAGGNLITQIFAHLLHPLHSVQPFTTKLHFGGACLISPWLALEGNLCTDSYKENDHNDIAATSVYIRWGKLVMANVPLSDVPYVDAVYAEEKWFEGISSLVDRILITSGENECLASAHTLLYEKYLAPVHDDVTFMRQEKGVHDQCLLEFKGEEGKLYSEFSGKVVDWVVQIFKNSS